jgi:hypothetical protein
VCVCVRVLTWSGARARECAPPPPPTPVTHSPVLPSAHAQAELQEDVQQVTERFWARTHIDNLGTRGARVAPHASHTYPHEQKEEELEVAARVKPSTRLESLARSKDVWMQRGNVPMDATGRLPTSLSFSGLYLAFTPSLTHSLPFISFSCFPLSHRPLCRSVHINCSHRMHIYYEDIMMMVIVF